MVFWENGNHWMLKLRCLLPKEGLLVATLLNLEILGFALWWSKLRGLTQNSAHPSLGIAFHVWTHFFWILFLYHKNGSRCHLIHKRQLLWTWYKFLLWYLKRWNINFYLWYHWNSLSLPSSSVRLPLGRGVGGPFPYSLPFQMMNFCFYNL